MAGKQFISWRGYETALMEIAEKIDKHDFNPDIIIGISRGGLPGAVMLSHSLDAELETLKATHYDGEEREDEVIIRENLPRLDGDILLFDDIVDTGRTMDAALSRVRQKVAANTFDRTVATAAVHAKPNREFEPDYWMKETEEWIVYPWEVSL